MNCPRCNSKSEVVKTHTQPTYIVKRDRKCLNKECGFNFTTEETLTNKTILNCMDKNQMQLPLDDN